MTVDHISGSSSQNQWTSLDGIKKAEGENVKSEENNGVACKMEGTANGDVKREENGILELAKHDAQTNNLPRNNSSTNNGNEDTDDAGEEEEEEEEEEERRIQNSDNEDEEEDDEDRKNEDSDNEDDLKCGLGILSPKWMQIFASKQAFLVTFCITWVLQGMYYTYFVSVITTIEKLFQIQSKTTGIIMSATEIGQIGSSLLLTYYGGQGHRPKWIAWGMVLFAVSSFMCSLPHFIFGEQLIQDHQVLYSGTTKVNVSEQNTPPNLCRSVYPENYPSMKDSLNFLQESSNGDARNAYLMLHSESQTSDNNNNNHYNNNNKDNNINHRHNRGFPLGINGSATNSSGYFKFPDFQSCGEDILQVQRTQSKITQIVLAIFFISLLGVGMGQTAVYTLGIPYIDDNVAKRESPLYFAITIGVRILGPAMGFILGSLCTRLYADLSFDPQITPTDPRWVGAWWLGLVMVSAMLMLSSLAMFSFPKRLKRDKGKLPTQKFVKKKNNPSLKDFPKAVKRLLKNDILMFRTASSVLHILPIAGLYTFLPKYLESQFRLAAHTANMISGVGGILVMGLGIIISGVFILRVKPKARFVAGWIAFTAIVYSIGMGILMLIGCPMDDFAGLDARRAGQPDFQPLCNTTCSCDRDKFSPVCGVDGRTYFSACHAGCRNVTREGDNKIVGFSDCLCIGDIDNTTISSTQTPLHTPVSTANIGFCDLDCSNFVPYILLFSMFVFIHSTSEVGSMLLILRCVDPRDKAMALGLIQFAIGLFGNVPCPIVYGAVVDYACLVWDKACGKQGACWLYDTDLFRMFYHGTTGAILLCAFFVDLVVWYKAGSINFVDDQVPEKSEELCPMKQRSETSV